MNVELKSRFLGCVVGGAVGDALGAPYEGLWGDLIPQAKALFAELERPIITPFVVPTVLACLYSLIKHPDSWTDAVSHVLHLGGDVDTTGAITGGLMGTRLGLGAIPLPLATRVVDAERLRVLATRLHAWAASAP